MRVGPLLTAHSYMRIERPPLLWDADVDDARFLPLLGEMIAASLGKGTPLGELTLNASNVVVEPSSDDGGDLMAPPAGEYVAITVSGAADFGPDATWSGEDPMINVLLQRLSSALTHAGVVFAYIRQRGDQGSFTVFLPRLRDGT